MNPSEDLLAGLQAGRNEMQQKLDDANEELDNLSGDLDKTNQRIATLTAERDRYFEKMEKAEARAESIGQIGLRELDEKDKIIDRLAVELAEAGDALSESQTISADRQRIIDQQQAELEHVVSLAAVMRTAQSRFANDYPNGDSKAVRRACNNFDAVIAPIALRLNEARKALAAKSASDGNAAPAEGGEGADNGS